jgi:hypothetical protein
VAGPVLSGAPAVAPAFTPTNWDAAGSPTSYAATTVGAATPEAYVCFRCHSSYITAIPNDPSGLPAPPWSTGGAGFTNAALEFSPSNASGHPVLASLNDYPNSPAPKTLTAAQLVGTDRTWTPGQKMTCTDCHSSDAASPAAQGPHGSAYRYMLAGTNRAWPYTVAGATSGTLFSLGINADDNLGTPNGQFCRNCHPKQWENSAYWGSNEMHRFFGNGHGGNGGGTCPNQCRECVRCHLVVPHGGKVSRLIATVNAPARYKIPGFEPIFDGFTKGVNKDDYECNFSVVAGIGCIGQHCGGPPQERW